jgi:hypothetical protein
MGGYLLIKKSFVNSNGLLKLKKWTNHLINTTQNGNFYFELNSKFVIETQHIM